MREALPRGQVTGSWVGACCFKALTYGTFVDSFVGWFVGECLNCGEKSPKVLFFPAWKAK